MPDGTPPLDVVSQGGANLRHKPVFAGERILGRLRIELGKETLVRTRAEMHASR